jgi:hypothetical protein
MSRSRQIAILLTATLAFGLLVVAAFGCGYSSTSKDVVEGEPVELGGLKYNVIFSRFLNPNDAEDTAYLVGQAAPPPGSTYFGVFFEVQNDGKEPQSLPQSLTITDAGHQTYRSLTSKSLYALPLGREVEAEEQLPVLDSTPQQGPIEGSLVLFLLPSSASENRPLTLQIPGPEPEVGEVTLDL